MSPAAAGLTAGDRICSSGHRRPRLRRSSARDLSPGQLMLLHPAEAAEGFCTGVAASRHRWQLRLGR